MFAGLAALGGLSFLGFVFVLLALFVLAGVYFQFGFLMNIVKRVYPKVFWYQDTNHYVLALTIDDAPSENTNDILDLLDRFNCKATFFIIASQAKKFPEVMERIKASGHEMGNHMCKDRPSFKLSPAKYEEKLLKCDAMLKNFGAFDSFSVEEPTLVYPETKKITNESNSDESSDAFTQYKWTRPGSGFFNDTMLETASKHGYSTALGNVYPFDPQIRFPALNGRHVVWRTSAGSVIIIHDRPYTCPSLEYILTQLAQDKQYQFLTLTQLANYPNKKL